MSNPNLVQVLPQQIYWTRRDRGYTQSELAEKAGVSVSTISDFETGRRKPETFRFQTLFKIAFALDCAVIANFKSPREEFRADLVVEGGVNRDEQIEN